MRARERWSSTPAARTTTACGSSPGWAKKLKASHDRRFVFVRTGASIQRIDTQNCDSANPKTCERIEWLDQIDPQSCGTDLIGCQPISPNVSDLAVDDYNAILNTASVGGS